MGTTRMADQLGRVLGDRYRLLAPIGAGASGHVYLADDVRLRRRVAVKVLHPALAGDEAFLRRFRAEARAAAALNHPNVMAVFDWGEEADGPYLVCEHLAGGSLRSMLDNGRRLSVSQALVVGLQAAQGLDYAHRRGLVHRDIKPANILFDDDGRLRIADFGLARALAEAAWTEPLGAVLGTARYASPEQVNGAPLDGKADVYSLAVVLVEAVTGTVPFAADTTVATLMARLERPLEGPAELGPLGPVVTRAGRPDPAERLDAAALATSLQVAALDLPSPQPLPLAGLPPVDEEAVGRDITDIGVGRGATTSDATVATAAVGGAAAVGSVSQRSGGVFDGADSFDTTGVMVGPTVVAPSPRPGPVPQRPEIDPSTSRAGRRRRRRWPYVLLALLVLVGGGAGAYAVVQARIPSHPLPDVRQQQRATAEAALRALDFDVVVAEEFFDGSEVGRVEHQDPVPAPGTKLKEGSKVKLVVSKGPAPTPVPDLTGLDQAGAAKAITDVGHAVGKVATRSDEDVVSGRIIDWTLKGEQPPKGASIDLVVSSGPRPRDMPDLTGRTFEQASAALADLGLKAARADTFTDDDDEKGKVVATSPKAGTKVPRDSSITVTVSKGQPVVPNVEGLTADAAAARIEAAELKVGNRFGPSSGKVFLTTPTANTKVKPGASVNLYLI